MALYIELNFQGTILAQIALTAFSLDNLSQAHWTARGFITFSLVSSIISVYYATKQYRILGRLLSLEEIRSWIIGAPARAPGKKPPPPNDWPSL